MQELIHVLQELLHGATGKVDPAYDTIGCEYC